MPCAGATLTQEQTDNRANELSKLERLIESGKVTVKRNGTKVEFVGWTTDRTGPGHWHDDCAFRTLQAQGSAALRMALMRQQSNRVTQRGAR
jgi:hypothetical protein